MEPVFTFADRLEQLKRLRGLTNTDLARICKIDKSNITRYCKGNYKAKQDVVYRMAEKLGIEEAWLMGYDVPMEKDPGTDKKEPTVLSAGEPNKDSIELFNMIRMLSDDQRRMIIAQVQGILQFQKPQDDQ